MDENTKYVKHKVFDNWENAKNTLKINEKISLRFGLKKICLLRTRSGFFALEDACPHKLVKLSVGRLQGGDEIECYWHKYRFNLKTGEECTGKNIRPVKVYSFIEEEDGIFIQVPESPSYDSFDSLGY